MESLGAKRVSFSRGIEMDSLAEYIVSVSGKKREVKLLGVSGVQKALVELDGETVEVAGQMPLTSGKLTSIKVNGRSYKVKVDKNNRPRVFNVEVDGKHFVLELQTKPKRSSNSTRKTYAHTPYVAKRHSFEVSKRGCVTSSMPGKIVLLKVKSGDRVEVGDPLCILEAMKMENEVVAPVRGIVEEVKIDQGSSVDKGDLLVVITEL